MKIIILGSSGMLGSYMLNVLYSNKDNIIGISRSNYPEFNFCDAKSTIKLIKSFKPDAVINCVAETSISACEDNRELADQINTITPALISEFCYIHNIFFVHISTDHFYSQGGKIAHKEDDPVQLLNHYAVSKFEAENRITSLNPNALVIRTSIIGRTKEGKTFLDWVIRSIEAKERLNLFSNAFVSFIHCNQLAMVIKSLINKKIVGLFNVSCSEVFSKAEFVISLANALSVEIDYQLGDVSELTPPRPNSCGLSSSKLEQKTGIYVPSFKNVVELVASEYKNE
tara:strand:- start:674 stop:1528 length:855 start_codon:yes stop_codon:yes gene_type:complete